MALPNLALDDQDVQRYLTALDHRTRDLTTAQDRVAATDPAGRDLAGVGAAVATSLDDLCRWAWLAAIGPLLERSVSRLRPSPNGRAPRLILVPMGDLARIPWHAARDDDGRYAVIRRRQSLEEMMAGEQLPQAWHET